MYEIRPCSISEYARVPAPVPRNNSVTSRNRTGTLLSRYWLSPLSRNIRRVTSISR
jgi:hypothetical protein